VSLTPVHVHISAICCSDSADFWQPSGRKKSRLLASLTILWIDSWVGIAFHIPIHYWCSAVDNLLRQVWYCNCSYDNVFLPCSTTWGPPWQSEAHLWIPGKVSRWCNSCPRTDEPDYSNLLARHQVWLGILCVW